jgi:exopolysaccharide production protein ExoY
MMKKSTAAFALHRKYSTASRALTKRGNELYAQFGKRALDITLTLAFLPLWLPLVGLIWCLAWLEAGQGFYSEIRVGQHGADFRCWKIRTMSPGTPRGCAANKAQIDPRITPIGRFLRRSSLDELPQLIAVLFGRMSLVGPRPVPRTELQRYGTRAAQYKQMRPGLTGLWQVSGRNATSYGQRIFLDTRYANSSSLWLDITILCATLREIGRLSGR